MAQGSLVRLTFLQVKMRKSGINRHRVYRKAWLKDSIGQKLKRNLAFSDKAQGVGSDSPKPVPGVVWG